MLITVFTPTYNRSLLLPRLFESLKVQTFTDFEWLIVDDGSVDDTEELVRGWLTHQSSPLSLVDDGGVPNLRYIRQQNGGKHRAINHGVREARGELFMIVDSDDRLPEDALKRVAYYYEQVKGDTRFAGVCGLKCYFDGGQTGGEQPFDTTDCSMLDIRLKHHIVGDMAEVFRTEVLREMPFPEIDGERFCPEALVWNRISQKYVMRYFHENIYECEYQPDGLTAKIVRIRMESPVATMMTYQELNSYEIPFAQKVKAAINYWRFRPCVPKGKPAPKLPWQWAWFRPIGWLMHLRDTQ